MPDPKKLGSGFCEKGLAGPGLQTLPAMSVQKVCIENKLDKDI